MANTLGLVVRFTVPIPDLPLEIAAPQVTSTLGLKLLLRVHLPSIYASNRLRLIHLGKVLPDEASLWSLLKPAIAPAGGDDLTQSAKKKGKAPLRDLEAAPSPPKPLIYIHCSIGDTFPPADLAAESSAASAAQARLTTALETGSPSTETSSSQIPFRSTKSTHQNGPPTSSVTPAPRGFDRLVSAGLSRDDITSLRRTFLAHLAHTHTPDTMPQGATLLALEDRWLDNTTPGLGAGDAGVAGFAAGGGGGGDDDDEGSALDDLLWGNLIGFFWPIGAIVWGFREEGVWTRRRQVAVLTGVVTNLVFGFARWSS